MVFGPVVKTAKQMRDFEKGLREFDDFNEMERNQDKIE